MTDRHCEFTGKRCFLSIEEARRGTRRISARLRVYRCGFCRFFHLTNDQQK